MPTSVDVSTHLSCLVSKRQLVQHGEREDICNGHSEASPANRLGKTQKLKYEFKRAV